MKGPYTIEIVYVMTDGKQVAEVKGKLRPGAIPTQKDIDALAATAMEQLAGVGTGWRPLTRNEFENMLIAEATGGTSPRMATAEEWDTDEAPAAVT